MAKQQYQNRGSVLIASLKKTITRKSGHINKKRSLDTPLLNEFEFVKSFQLLVNIQGSRLFPI